ncbi:hypothetical protein FUAX_09980 [Fulvitalea axinellae]|uniref:Uncharacterized protein n=1 Tax=Fulvitalea axinellae TaxID=1182444 RepID=A0AAU9CI66_9BACT|nr:hypothetical protein FUAX_09980 [Fulvitalea axinellae]
MKKRNTPTNKEKIAKLEKETSRVADASSSLMLLVYRSHLCDNPLVPDRKWFDRDYFVEDGKALLNRLSN